MRQNPAVTARFQVGGRPMPEWFSKSLQGNQAHNRLNGRNTGQTPPPFPPLPPEPPPIDADEDDDGLNAEESEYEEIDHLPAYSNSDGCGGGLIRRSAGVKWVCSLCGNCNPAVTCQMCNNQVFCGACNEMFHRHPKRHNHVRKLLENVQSRPPLPPKAFQHQQMAVHQQQAPVVPLHMRNSSPSPQQFAYHNQQAPDQPIPPPRRNRRFGSTSNLRSSANNSPTLTRKFSFDPMGSLKRFVKRPLPGLPTGQNSNPKPGLPIPAQSKFSSSHGVSNPVSTFHPNTWKNDINARRQQQQLQQVLERPSSSNQNHPEFARANIPLSVLEISNRGNSRSFVNLSDKQNNNSSRDSGYRGWGEDDNEMNNQNHMTTNDFQRSINGHSFSATNLHRISSSNPATHFATLQRVPRNVLSTAKPLLRPPPPIPPREFTEQGQFGRNFDAQQEQMFQSAFELNRAGAFVPWARPGQNYQQEFQPDNQFRQRGYLPKHGPEGFSTSSLRRNTTSNIGKPTAFGPPMSQSELESQIFDARRGSEPPSLNQQTYGNEFPEERRSRNPDPPRSTAKNRVSTPVKLVQKPMETKYYPGEFDSSPNRQHSVKDEDEFDPVVPTKQIMITENPEGPWSCEHCTFVNPKSTRVCTICCKTPLEGYRTIATTTPGGAKMSKNPMPIIDPKLSISAAKNSPKLPQKIKVIEQTVPAPPGARTNKKMPKSPPPPIAAKTSSSLTDESESDESDSDESSDEEEIITQRQKYISPKRQLSNRKSYSRQISGNVKEKEGTIKPKPVLISTAVGSSSSPNSSSSGRNIDIGQLSISDEEELPPSPIKKKAPAQHDTKPTVRSQLPQTSKGTSPPPQTISTQTYEELPAASNIRSKSISKSSLQSDVLVSTTSSSRETSPPPAPKIELSDKAMRYARRAQQQSKLKRSASAHLYSASSTNNDPWMLVDPHHPNYHHRHPNHHLYHHHGDYDGQHLYRSSSRHSLASDTRSLPISGPPSRDTSPGRGPARFYDDFRNSSSSTGFPLPPTSWDRFPSPGDYFASIEDLVTRKRRESIKSQEFELSRLLKDAEELNYSPEDVQVALRMCGDRNPVKWLQDNWSSMIETVQTLATKYGREKGQELNDVGTISSSEAKEALRLHRGNVWAGVTECVEQRRKKFAELQSRGTFLREDVLTALTANHGNLDAAYVELSKAQLKPFLMRIWGPPSGHDNETSVPRSESILSLDSTVELNGKVQPSSSLIQQNNGVNICRVKVQGSTTGTVINQNGTEEMPEPASNENVNTKIQIPSSSKMPITNSRTTMAVAANVISAKNENMTYDPEEESFVDAISDDEFYNTIPESSAEDGNARKESLISNSSSSSDPEIIDENHVSNFIQNFLIPEPTKPAIPKEFQSQPKETATLKVNQVEHMALATIHGQSPTPSDSSSMGNRTSSQLEKLFDDPHQQMISPQHQLANLAKAMNLITEKLGVLLKQQDQMQEQDGEVAQLKGRNDTQNGNINRIFKKSLEETLAQVPMPLEQIDAIMPLESTKHVQGDANGEEPRRLEIQAKSDHSNALSGSQSLANASSNELQVLKEIYKDELKVLRDLVLNEGISHVNKNEIEGDQNSTKASALHKSEIPQVLKSGPAKLYAAMGNLAGSFFKPSPSKLVQEVSKSPVQWRKSNNSYLPLELTSTNAPVSKASIFNINETDEPIQLHRNSTPSLPDDLMKIQNQFTQNQPARMEGLPTTSSPPEPIEPDTKLQKMMKELLSMDKVEIVTISQDQDTEIPPNNNNELSEDEEIYEEEDADVEEAELDFEGDTGSESGSVVSNSQEGEGESESFDDDNDEELEDSDEANVEAELLQVKVESDLQSSTLVDVEAENEEAIYEEIEVSYRQDNMNYYQVADAVVDVKEQSRIKVKAAKNSGQKRLSPGESKPSYNATTAIANSYASINSAHADAANKKLLEKQIQKFMSNGQVRTFEQGEMALKLIDMNFNEDDSLAAATECSSLYTALCFLQQECLLCAGKFSAKQMISMLQCVHRCCRTCAAEYFMVQIRDRPIIDLTCPFCKEPSNLSDEPEFAATDYFSQLDIVLKDILSERYHEMFQRKLRDWALAKTPNFKWCSKCSSGFIMEPMQTRLVCPDCNAVTCAICLQQWDKDNHDHKDARSDSLNLCDDSPSTSESTLKSIVNFLNENCIECPKCHLKFTLARGGCMHLTCTQCRFEFCSGCASQFRMGSKCSENAFCLKLGLHAHHPRNCLFYLRDKEPQMLLKLLEDNKIIYHKEDASAAIVPVETSGPEASASESIVRSKKSKCQVPIQKETENGAQDELCGQETCPGHATVCLLHYVEYLGLLIWQNHLDPISLLSNDDLETIIKRAHKKIPGKPYGTSETTYRPLLLKVIEAEIPL